MNAESSRSHSVFSITVHQKDNISGRIKKARLFLVDLAGSEKISKTGASGTRLEEAKNINGSLTTLGMVINALCDGSSHVPYRDSKLTRLLMDALGGNSKTCLIICCAPELEHLPETLSTLRFGERAKKIKNKARINEEQSIDELKILLNEALKEIIHLKSLNNNNLYNNLQIDSLNDSLNDLQSNNQCNELCLNDKKPFNEAINQSNNQINIQNITQNISQIDYNNINNELIELKLKYTQLFDQTYQLKSTNKLLMDEIEDIKLLLKTEKYSKITLKTELELNQNLVNDLSIKILHLTLQTKAISAEKISLIMNEHSNQTNILNDKNDRNDLIGLSPAEMGMIDNMSDCNYNNEKQRDNISDSDSEDFIQTHGHRIRPEVQLPNRMKSDYIEVM